MAFYRYLGKRLVMTAAVVVVCISFLAGGANLIPGNPATTLLGKDASPQLIATTRRDMGLDKPVYIQIKNYFAGLLHGNFGTDFRNNDTVKHELGVALPHTVVLAFASMIIAILIGIPLGVFVATKLGTWIDKFVMAISIGMITIPQFVFVLAALLVFSVQLHLFPALGTGDFSHPIDYLHHLVLPAFALAIPWIGYLPRLIRANMVEVLGSEYIRSARTFGLRERVIFYKYALKNALIPTVAVFGLGLGTTMAGTVFAETSFGRQGLGTLAYNALQGQNWPLVRATVLLFALFIVLSNLLADLSYRFFDPRIKLEEADAGG
jgi:peptide/nickel transport system permease protein